MLNVRPLTPPDLPAADRIISLAFGTFLGAPEPDQFWADLAYARGGRRIRPPPLVRNWTANSSGRILPPAGEAWDFSGR
jgi:hypothetical protein